MANLREFYCRLNETSHASQFKWLDNTFKEGTVIGKKNTYDFAKVLKIF
jgi:hypothetical protein